MRTIVAEVIHHDLKKGTSSVASRTFSSLRAAQAFVLRYNRTRLLGKTTQARLFPFPL